MEALSDKEIEHLASLLLMDDTTNYKLAKVLLEPHYHNALPRMRAQALMYWLFQPNDLVFNTWVEEILAPPPREEHPFYPLVQAHWRAEQAVQSWKTLVDFLPTWQVQSVYFEASRDRQSAYHSLYADLCLCSLEQPEHSAPVLLYLFRKVVTFLERYTIPRRSQLLLKWVSLLQQYKPLGYASEVMDAYEQAYRLRPSPNPLYTCGQFFEHQIGDVDQALAYYERCYSIYEEHVPALIAAAQIHFQRDQQAPAHKLASQALYYINEEDGIYDAQEHSTVYTLLGRIQWAQHVDAAAATAHYQQALAISPTHCMALVEWSQLLLLQPKGWAKVDALFEEALDYGQDEWAIYRTWGGFCEQHQQLASALSIYQRAAAQQCSTAFSEDIQRVTTALNQDHHGADS